MRQCCPSFCLWWHWCGGNFACSRCRLSYPLTLRHHRLRLHIHSPQANKRDDGNTIKDHPVKAAGGGGQIVFVIIFISSLFLVPSQSVLQYRVPLPHHNLGFVIKWGLGMDPEVIHYFNLAQVCYEKTKIKLALILTSCMLYVVCCSFSFMRALCLCAGHDF